MRQIGWSKMKMNASMGSQWEAKKIACLVGGRMFFFKWCLWKVWKLVFNVWVLANELLMCFK